MIEDQNIHRINFNDKEIILIGTAHISRESVELVKSVIQEEKPDTVCVELCKSRYQAIKQKDRWENTDIIKVIKEKKAFLLLSNLILSSFQKKIAKKLDIKPGSEMLQAIESGEAIGADIHLADREISITLARTWRFMGFWNKMKLAFEMLLSVGSVEDISEEDIEKMKQQDVLETILAEIGQSLPELRRILIDERDLYLTYKIRTAPGKKIVAVIGAGHVPGIIACLNEDVDIDKLNELPPKSKLSSFFKWGIPSLIILFIILGFFHSGASVGTDMIKLWIIANATLAGLGAILAFAHPLTIISAALSAPLTSLNPMIAAGWVSGLVEAFSRKPKVKDFQHLSDDLVSIKGFWKNKITRILLVVVFTNIGSSFGTFIAIPMMIKVFGV
ncbi:TraB/GumN family protein [Candidatus Magnetomoraceae bacterium gMMP-15]